MRLPSRIEKLGVVVSARGSPRGIHSTRDINKSMLKNWQRGRRKRKGGSEHGALQDRQSLMQRAQTRLRGNVEAASTVQQNIE